MPKPMQQITLDEAATLVVRMILDHGLKHSTFNDLYPDAYKELLKYRQDLKLDIRRALRGKTIFEEG